MIKTLEVKFLTNVIVFVKPAVDMMLYYTQLNKYMQYIYTINKIQLDCSTLM